MNSSVESEHVQLKTSSVEFTHCNPFETTFTKWSAKTTQYKNIWHEKETKNAREIRAKIEAKKIRWSRQGFYLFEHPYTFATNFAHIMETTIDNSRLCARTNYPMYQRSIWLFIVLCTTAFLTGAGKVDSEKEFWANSELAKLNKRHNHQWVQQTLNYYRMVPLVVSWNEYISIGVNASWKICFPHIMSIFSRIKRCFTKFYLCWLLSPDHRSERHWTGMRPSNSSLEYIRSRVHYSSHSTLHATVILVTYLEPSEHSRN